MMKAQMWHMCFALISRVLASDSPALRGSRNTTTSFAVEVSNISLELPRGTTDSRGLWHGLQPQIVLKNHGKIQAFKDAGLKANIGSFDAVKLPAGWENFKCPRGGEQGHIDEKLLEACVWRTIELGSVMEVLLHDMWNSNCFGINTEGTLDPDDEDYLATVDYIKHKAFPRSLMKSRCRYGGDVHSLTDVARQSYVFKSVAAMKKGLELFEKKDLEQYDGHKCETQNFGYVKWQIVRVKNRFGTPGVGTDRGYRDLLTNIMIEEFGPVKPKIDHMIDERKTKVHDYFGRVVEMQFHLSYFKALKNDPTHFGHDIFKAFRIFDERMQCAKGGWKGCEARCPCEKGNCKTWLGETGIDWDAAGSKVRRALEAPQVQEVMKKSCQENKLPNEHNGLSWTAELFNRCANPVTSKALSDQSFDHFNKPNPEELNSAAALSTYKFAGCDNHHGNQRRIKCK